MKKGLVSLLEEMRIGLMVSEITHQLIWRVDECVSKQVDKQITATAARIMSAVYMNEGQKDVYQRDIEKYIGLKRSSVSMALTAMEKRGLIVRCGVQGDGRLNKIMLTPYARLIVPAIHKVYENIEEKIFGVLTEEEGTTFIKLLAKVTEAL